MDWDRLYNDTDDALEEAIRDRLTLSKTLERPFRVLRNVLADAGIRVLSTVVRTYDESLELREFLDGDHPWPTPRGSIWDRVADRESVRVVGAEMTITALPIDVAGELFGGVALLIDGPLEPDDLDIASKALHRWVEQVDNSLASIAQARTKHQLTRELGRALRDPVLDTGLEQAINILRRHIDFQDLVLVFRNETRGKQAALHYKVLLDGVMHDSSSVVDAELDTEMRRGAAGLISGADRELLTTLGLSSYREEALINGLRDEQVMGRVILTCRQGDDFNTFDRDLVERFCDYLRQRLVDFNREWNVLSNCFPSEIVSRLLAEEGYLERHLSPRERDVAILFCDISGFTRISEQILREPRLIGQLIDTWAARVVDIVWATGGVFDKMVGDCVIALWGPPFFERTADDDCRRATDAAAKIRDFTKTLGDDPNFPQLQGGPPMGVASGVNWAPLFVGRFGPNDDYTGFSSGMNNTARLQGLAQRDEILCMEPVVGVLGDSLAFGPIQEARVKNVANPLVFRRLEGPSS